MDTPVEKGSRSHKPDAGTATKQDLRQAQASLFPHTGVAHLKPGQRAVLFEGFHEGIRHLFENGVLGEEVAQQCSLERS